MIVGLAGGVETAAAAEVVAHRGASADAPENTLPAFELAWAQGADAIEGDFWMTADGVVACIHDQTTERVAGGQKVDVCKVDFADLQRLDVGTWKGERWAGTRVPTLGDVLATVPAGKRVFVEIKDGSRVVPAVAEAVVASGLADDQVRVIAFDRDVVAAAKSALPEIKVYWLVGRKLMDKLGTGGIVSAARSAGADGISVQAGKEPWAGLVRAATAAALELHTWTIDDPGQARNFTDAGYRSVTTNRPGPVGDAVRE